MLDLAKPAKEIYENSKVEKKRQILNFLFSNLEVKDKKAIITLHELFDKLIAVSDHPCGGKQGMVFELFHGENLVFFLRNCCLLQPNKKNIYYIGAGLSSSTYIAKSKV